MPKLDTKAQSELERRVQLLAKARERFLEMKSNKLEASTETGIKRKKRKRKSLPAPLHGIPTEPQCVSTEILNSKQQDPSAAQESPLPVRSSAAKLAPLVSGVTNVVPAAARVKANPAAKTKYVPAQSVSSHPFATDLGDHCETPFEAYADVAPLLHGLARDLGLSAAQLRIYDPYYCEGGAKVHLAALGFTTVINENVDFYEAPLSPSEYDVLLTNPPYSSDHVPRLLKHCAALSYSSDRRPKPWLLLVPAYVHEKPYYAPLVPPSQGVCYLWPWRRYAYWSPGGIRGRAMAVTPFESVWHVQFYGAATKYWEGIEVHGKGSMNGGNSSGKGGKDAGKQPALTCTLFQSIEALQNHGARNQIARTPKRPNPKARKRAANKVNGLRTKNI